MEFREAFPVNADVPVCSQRSTQAQEKETADCRNQDVGRDQRIHEDLVGFVVLDAQKEKTDGYLGEHDDDEGLHPVDPADDVEPSPLVRLQIVHVSSQAIEHFSRHESKAYEVDKLADDHNVIIPLCSLVSPNRIVFPSKRPSLPYSGSSDRAPRRGRA